MAQLAAAPLSGTVGNVPTVTGARQPAVLGGVYWGAKAETKLKHSDSSGGHPESQTT